MPDFSGKIQRLCNAIIRDDPGTLQKTRTLAGRAIAIEITGPDITISIEFDEEGNIHLQKDTFDNPDVVISAGVTSYLRLMLNKNSVINRSTPDMFIQGDIGLAQDFQQILDNLEIDWEEYLSHWIGDMPAHKLSRLSRTGSSYVRQVGETLAKNINEYLLYEKQVLPDNDEVEEFNNAVDALRNDTDRLKQRIFRLENQIFKTI